MCLQVPAIRSIQTEVSSVYVLPLRQLRLLLIFSLKSCTSQVYPTLQIFRCTEYLICFFSVSHFMHVSLLPVTVEYSPWSAEKVIFVDMFYLCVVISQDMLEVSVVTNIQCNTQVFRYYCLIIEQKVFHLLPLMKFQNFVKSGRVFGQCERKSLVETNLVRTGVHIEGKVVCFHATKAYRWEQRSSSTLC